MDSSGDSNGEPKEDGAGAVTAASSHQHLQPWEQHAGVIHMPRYLYGAREAAALLPGSSGFLVTCTFQREKSATKEAMALLHEFMGITEPTYRGESIQDAKRAKTGEHTHPHAPWRNSLTPTKLEAELQPPQLEPTTREVGEQHRVTEAKDEGGDEAVKAVIGKLEPVDSHNSVREAQLENCLAQNQEEPNSSPEFSLVKLARRGMVYISISSCTPRDLLGFFSKLLTELHARQRAAPQWCHRMFPVQSTCHWRKDDIGTIVVILVKEFLEEHDLKGDAQLKYAVAVNRRGLEELESIREVAAASSTFGKMECIHAVAEAVQSVASHTSVDLTNPQMVVMIEVLPLVRVESAMCAVTVLPRELVVTKPKLLVQSLAPPKKRKQKG